jgi:hypothetical protein
MRGQKKGAGYDIPTTAVFKFVASNAVEVRKFAVETNMIIVNESAKTFTLREPFRLDDAMLKLYEDYASRGFLVIEKASKLGSKRSTVNNSGAVLTQEGYEFVTAAYLGNDQYAPSVSGDDVARYGRSLGVREDRLLNFVEVYNKFILALNLAMNPSYGDEALNNKFRGVLNSALSSKLLHMYKSLKYAKTANNRYEVDSTLAIINTAYQQAVNTSNAARIDIQNRVGPNNYDYFVDLLRQYDHPDLTEQELYDIESGRTKTEKAKRTKIYEKAHRERLLLELRRLDHSIDDKNARTKARSIGNFTEEGSYTHQGFMAMSHAILSPSSTDPDLKGLKLPSSVQKERKILLKTSIDANLQSFSDAAMTDANQVSAYAYSLIQGGQYAVASKLINAYIKATIDFLSKFVKENNVKQPSHRTAKINNASVVSMLH